MALLVISVSAPHPPLTSSLFGNVRDVSDNGLPSWLYRNVFDAHVLLAASAQLRKRLDLTGEGALQPLKREPDGIELGQARLAIQLAGHLHRQGVRCRHLQEQHGLDLVSRLRTVQNG